MTTQQSPAVRVGEGSRITLGVATLAWVGAWLGGTIVAGAVFAAIGRSGDADTQPVWITVVTTAAGWVPMLFVLREVSQRYGVRSFVEDYGVRFRARDLLGIPIGALSQLVLLRIIYWPLKAAWPVTFSEPRLEKAARTLYDSANGAWLIALLLLVVVGAPVVEELLYRGLLQGAFVRRVDDVVAVFVVAAWFAIIHFRPVEYPGLFAFGLVLGICALSTKRIGMSMITHFAFNLTGLIWVATR
jgi:uncharacterized protein